MPEASQKAGRPPKPQQPGAPLQRELRVNFTTPVTSLNVPGRPGFNARSIERLDDYFRIERLDDYFRIERSNDYFSGGWLMSSVRRITIFLIASVGVLLACVVPASAEIFGRVFTVDLTGAAEVNAAGVPNQGDPDGSGTATVSINPGTGEVCWTIEVADVDPILAAHIHVAPSTAPGPIVVHLDPDTGCTDAPIDRALALAIITDPSAYYVNVHNETYPTGALRGQLAFAR